MSKYTTDVRTICESYANLQGGYAEINDILTLAIPKVFSFDFPIFEESYRYELERKILMHFYTREIAEETVGLWKLRLESTLNEIMPYYNNLYVLKGNATNLFNNKDITRTYAKLNDGTGETVGMYSDTPQGALTGVMNEEYLTNANKSNSQAENKEVYGERITGYDGITFIENWKQYVDYFKDIDVMILNDLETLFLQLW